MTEKRKRIEAKIYEIIGYLDNKDGLNLSQWKEFLGGMSDEQFGKWCNWCNDPKDVDQLDHTVFIQTLPFEEPSLDNILKGLDALGVPAEEYVWFKDFNKDNNEIRSRYKIPVGYIHIKRMEQLLSKKNKSTTDNDSRNIKTGQVTGESKVAALSDSEAFALISHIDPNDDSILKEIYGPRSGDDKERNQLYKDIALNGYASINDIEAESNIENKETLSNVNAYLLSAGLRTDLISTNLKLPYTEKKEIKKK